ALADDVEVGEDAAGVLDLAERQVRRLARVTINKLVEGETLAAELAVLASLAIDDQLRTREAVLAQVEEEIDLTLHLDLALHFVDLEEIPAFGGIQPVVRVD